MSEVLGTGQAQVLAALIRRANSGPVSLADLARDTGFTRTRIRRCVAALAAKDLLERTDAGPVPRVVPLSVDSARVSVGRDYAGEAEGRSACDATASLPEPPLLRKDVGNDP